MLDAIIVSVALGMIGYGAALITTNDLWALGVLGIAGGVLALVQLVRTQAAEKGQSLD